MAQQDRSATAKKAAQTRKHRAAGKKAALTGKRREAGENAALRRKHRQAGIKAAETRRGRAAAKASELAESRSDKFTWQAGDLRVVKLPPKNPSDDPEFLENLEAFMHSGDDPDSEEGE